MESVKARGDLSGDMVSCVKVLNTVNHQPEKVWYNFYELLGKCHNVMKNMLIFKSWVFTWQTAACHNALFCYRLVLV